LLKKTNFIERSIMGALSFFKDSIYAEEYAHKKGFLQLLDSRVKVVAVLLLLILVLFVKSIPILLCLYFFCLLLSVFSKINLLFFLKRTWFFIPLFSLFITIPALFSFITPGKALFVFNSGIIITSEGLFSAIRFISRVVASVSFVILLSLTTKSSELLKTLRVFKIPQVFVMTLGMCYRYIYLFVEIVEYTYLGIKSRVGLKVRHTKGRKLVGWNIANLWIRSYHLNNQVYNAMMSRGYRGEP